MNNDLISREALLDVLQHFKMPDYFDGAEAVCWIMDKIENATVIATAPTWVSVNDRLPEAYGDGSVDAVLVTDGSFIHMAYFSCGKWRFCESGEMKEEMFYSVTHWMPLPPVPGEEA